MRLRINIGAIAAKFLKRLGAFAALCLILCAAVSAQDTIPSAARYVAPADTSHVEVRMPEEATLNKFRNDGDFNYTQDVEYGKTFWETIKYYVWKFIRQVFYRGDGSEKWLRWLWMALLAGVAAFSVSKMLGVDVSGIFFKKPPPAVDLADTVINENVDRNQLGAMLDQALNEKQYRLAVRLAYLITLKRLSDTGQILWQADKTNRSYLNEISDGELRQQFAHLSRLYEYVWYGDFDVHAEHYREIEADFAKMAR